MKKNQRRCFFDTRQPEDRASSQCARGRRRRKENATDERAKRSNRGAQKAPEGKVRPRFWEATAKRNSSSLHLRLSLCPRVPCAMCRCEKFSVPFLLRVSVSFDATLEGRLNRDERESCFLLQREAPAAFVSFEEQQKNKIASRKRKKKKTAWKSKWNLDENRAVQCLRIPFWKPSIFYPLYVFLLEKKCNL